MARISSFVCWLLVCLLAPTHPMCRVALGEFKVKLTWRAPQTSCTVSVGVVAVCEVGRGGGVAHQLSLSRPITVTLTDASHHHLISFQFNPSWTISTQGGNWFVNVNVECCGWTRHRWEFATRFQCCNAELQEDPSHYKFTESIWGWGCSHIMSANIRGSQNP